jgi:hypothetical protein
VREIDLENSRRVHFQADTELKRLVGGFIREQVRPHLESGQSKVRRLQEVATDEGDPELRAFFESRVERLNYWIGKARFVLPLLHKVLGE